MLALVRDQRREAGAGAVRPPRLAPQGLVHVRVPVDETRQEQERRDRRPRDRPTPSGRSPTDAISPSRTTTSVASAPSGRTSQQQQIARAHAASVQRCGCRPGLAAPRAAAAPSAPAGRRVAGASDREHVVPGAEEEIEELGVELRPAPGEHRLARLVGPVSRPVHAVRRQRVEDVCDRGDAALQRDLLALEALADNPGRPSARDASARAPPRGRAGRRPSRRGSGGPSPCAPP